jgi:hypothetical protein
MTKSKNDSMFQYEQLRIEKVVPKYKKLKETIKEQDGSIIVIDFSEEEKNTIQL